MLKGGRRGRRCPWRAGCLIALSLAGALPAQAAAGLPDGRGWEMVSPVEKNGGRVDPPETIAGGGVLQAARQGHSVTYGSASSFAGGAGAPVASQYVSTRTAGGWATENISPPVFSGSYDFTDGGAPYQLFSDDLARSLLRNGDRCEGEAVGCPVIDPPLAGTDAPAGFQNYYLREGSGFEALIGASDVAGHGLDPSAFEVRVVGASADLKTVVLLTCAPLTSGATDLCQADGDNLYEWSRETGDLTLVNSNLGAAPAAPAGAVSVDGGRIYWHDVSGGNLFLREWASAIQVDATAGGGGEFQVASLDGEVAFFTSSGHLYRYSGGAAADLTPSGGVTGVLGAGSSGDDVYYQDGGGLKRWSAGTTMTIAPGADVADPSTYPPATGASRVSVDGTKLLFLSKAKLTGYDNVDKVTGLPDAEVFLYDAAGGTLKCLSCNPRGRRPIGPSTIPGAIRNGAAAGSVQAYKPRALSADGRRIFFDSADALVVADSNSRPATGEGIGDVYEWEAMGEGDCAQPAGCLSIISNGALPDGASFADASADGSDAYFLTAASLLAADPGSMDLYDARVGGGLPEPASPIPCVGDACQILPPLPDQPSLATLAAGAGNPPVSYRKYCRRGYVKRKGICVKKGRRQHGKRRRHRHHRSTGGGG